jgi:SAM-dependent methyltransferase
MIDTTFPVVGTTTSMLFASAQPQQDSRAADQKASAYGVLVNELSWLVLKKSCLDILPPRFRFCDLGGGSAVWSLRTLREYPGASGTALFRSQRALSEALAQVEREGMIDRLRCVLTTGDPTSLPDGTFDLCSCLNDLLATTERPDVLLRHAVRIAKPGGLMVLLVPNLYHAVSVHLASARLEDAEQALSGRGVPHPGMPTLNLYTPRSIEDLLRRVGAYPKLTLGLPTTVRAPGEGAIAPTTDLSELLLQKDVRARVLEIEQMLLEASPVARGNVLLSIASAPQRAERWGEYWL